MVNNVTPIYPISTTGISNVASRDASNYKTMVQLCNAVTSLNNANASIVSGDLGPSGANSRALSTIYTATSRIFVAVTINNTGGTGTGAEIIPYIAGNQIGPVNSVTNSSGPCGTGFIVPAGLTYKVVALPDGGTPTIVLTSWFETSI